MVETHPGKYFFQYLASLPQTTKINIYWQIATYFVDEILSLGREDTDAQKFLEEHIRDVSDANLAFRRLVVAIGVMDFISESSVKIDAKYLEEKADEAGSINLKRMALQQPLRERYFENAMEEWRRLRQGDLSPKALHQYRGTLTAALMNSILS